MTDSLVVSSPIGPLELSATTDGRLRRISFVTAGSPAAPAGDTDHNKPGQYPDILATTARQLQEYFAGRRQAFALALAPAGTPFQQLVWANLARIPWGATTSYSELARQCGSPGAVRAVAGAVAANPLPIILPCHRVLPKNGSLGNYALHSLPGEQGQQIKRELLRIEGKLFFFGDVHVLGGS